MNTSIYINHADDLRVTCSRHDDDGPLWYCVHLLDGDHSISLFITAAQLADVNAAIEREDREVALKAIYSPVAS